MVIESTSKRNGIFFGQIVSLKIQSEGKGRGDDHSTQTALRSTQRETETEIFIFISIRFDPHLFAVRCTRFRTTIVRSLDQRTNVAFTTESQPIQIGRWIDVVQRVGHFIGTLRQMIAEPVRITNGGEGQIIQRAVVLKSIVNQRIERSIGEAYRTVSRHPICIVQLFRWRS